MADDRENEDTALGDLLRGLEHVDPPGDFVFRVKARIAAGNDSDRRRNWLVPVYVYPLTALVLVGSVFLIRGFYISGEWHKDRMADANLAQVANVPITKNDAPKNDAVPQPETPKNEVAIAVDKPIANESPRPIREKGNTNVLLMGGSRDSALTNTRQLWPRGIDPDKARQIGPMPNAGSSVSMNDVLGFLGMETHFEGESLKVASVRSGSIADRSGFKTGDIIEAIDGMQIKPSTKFGSRLTAKNFTVTRDGQPIELELNSR